MEGVGQVGVVALFAAFMATQALIGLLGVVKGVETTREVQPGAQQQAYDLATAWSLPKAETLRVIIPGLFGYRMDTPEGGSYWGSVGYPAYQRHSGAGEYAGILVVLIGILGAANAFRKQNNPYSELERRVVR